MHCESSVQLEAMEALITDLDARRIREDCCWMLPGPMRDESEVPIHG
jgi:hypothetical protein